MRSGTQVGAARGALLDVSEWCDALEFRCLTAAALVPFSATLPEDLRIQRGGSAHCVQNAVLGVFMCFHMLQWRVLEVNFPMQSKYIWQSKTCFFVYVDLM